MMFNRPRPLDITSRVWRMNEMRSDDSGDGPIALLRALIALAARYKISLLTCLFAGLMLAGLYAYSLPPTYKATAILLLEPRRSAASAGASGNEQSLDLNRADSELQTIKSERLLSGVFDSLKLQRSPELGPQPPGMTDKLLGYIRSWLDTAEGGKSAPPATGSSSIDSTLVTNADIAAFLNFTKRISARRVGQSFVIEIEYASSDPTLPARVANATVSGYMFQVIAFKEQIARAGTDALQGRLDSLARQVDAAREAMQSGTLPSIPTPDADARVIGAALPPLGPSAPRKSLIIALGGVLGLLGGFGFVAIKLALDRRVRDGKELSRELDLLCLGSIPYVAGADGVPWRITNLQQERFVAAIHDLRTSLEIACTSLRNENSIVVAVVAWTADAGVSTICRGLAELISRSDRHVTLFKAIDDDDDGSGPADNRMSPTGSLAGATFAKLMPDQLAFDEIGGVAVLPIHSADVNANLFADFRNPRVRQIIDAARSKGDVLLDLPALCHSTDALALAAYADVVLVVARAGQTTIEEVSESVQMLRRTGANVVGTVINRAR
ncbi:Wzz/FepE/Etk N-terminal domain-containing protein [Neorhizobium petrolearium]|uniref:Wzz/FepE/Etk N-terminal domain-containing protein n=1 Tax=Neorhizobium petrolearium TaxID=515361 RepID=A0ABY8LV81_9HYPH|nr:Wzz/FepE/Etk N-terminal domain-containing protein [Neorhizobium petrolearium]MCC2611020.1 exopolysaccharide biosynthesis protein [Neorhizobium petrolearium]WGI66237.1 Wzz/FepE/Etk N-terminal domain-containing protein [Neorhizobium petrolearium]